MDRVSLRMVESDNRYPLQDFIDDSLIRDLGYFNADGGSAIEKAVEYLKKTRYGIVSIPPEDSTKPASYLMAGLGSDYRPRVNYISYAKHPPISTSDERPMGLGAWEIGDVIYNLNDPSEFVPRGWLCISKGIPGLWMEIGFPKAYYSAEILTDLPLASHENEGRLVLLRSNLGTSKLVTCVQTGVDMYAWTDFTSGGEDEIGGSVVAALDSLGILKASAESLIDTAEPSPDGSDIDETQTWVPTTVYDELQVEIANSGSLIEKGEESQTFDGVVSQRFLLNSAMQSFERAKEPGVKASEAQISELTAKISETQNLLKITETATPTPFGLQTFAVDDSEVPVRDDVLSELTDALESAESLINGGKLLAGEVSASITRLTYASNAYSHEKLKELAKINNELVAVTVQNSDDIALCMDAIIMMVNQ